MEISDIKSIIEGLLFTWGDPLNIKDISNILEMKEEEVKKILKEMTDEFNYNKRGIKIVKTEDYYQLSSRSEHYPWIKKLYMPKENKSLSGASMETLSIIAYRQPITKNEIEAIRGVRCDKAIENLLEKDLIEEKGRLEKTGRPILYGTTIEFLKHIGISDLSELPKIEEFKEDDMEEK
ncbi:MAG: SMC-Scp complex subunit ScpB [Tissierellaceae bacterium]|jgi:segregation and condensation protein B|nr:SMC-Scp complex subunit ScpB [Tissierellaceae bacterium]